MQIQRFLSLVVLLTAVEGKANDLKIATGFQVEKVVAVPIEKMGSWVSITADDRGRLICSDQDGGLYRVTPPALGSSFDPTDLTSVERIDVAIGQAQGLLCVKKDLYVVVNGKSKPSSGLYRLRDSDDDDRFDELKLLKSFQGAGEHGPHGIQLGQDGKLYVIAGNATRPPDGLLPQSPHRNYQDDLLEPKGGKMLPGGWIARTDLDGKEWELFCGGLRNPYDLAFNADGELFTYDADSETDIGTAWYRPTRVNHVVSAGEYGWRFDTGKWPDYYPDSLGSVVDIGVGSPTGIEFGTSANFPSKYRRALFLGDWARGTIYAVHMTPRGATYTATFEQMVVGKPLPVTDLVVSKDGALYFTVGGRRATSALYRLRFVGDQNEERVDEEPPFAATATKQRKLRHALESYHCHKDPAAIDLAWPLLNHPDRNIRFAARLAIENQDRALWEARCWQEIRPGAVIEAMIMIARTDDVSLQAAVLKQLQQLPWSQLSERQTLAALRAYALAIVRLQGENSVEFDTLRDVLSPMYPTGSDRVNRELCRLLVYLHAPRVVDKSMKLLRVQATQQDQLFYIFALRNLKHGWTAKHRRAYFSWLTMAESKYESGARQLGRKELEGRFTRLIQRIRKDALATLTTDERSKLTDVLEGRAKVVAVDQETPRRFIHNWQMGDLEPLLNTEPKVGAIERGRELFRIAQCHRCHRIAGRGGVTGPDLTSVGNRFDTRYLVEALIQPSKVISDQYRQHVMITSDGRVLTGRVVSQDEQTTTIRTDPLSTGETTLRNDEIISRKPSPVSEMPTGLVNVLTKEEILDLIAYMRSGK